MRKITLFFLSFLLVSFSFGQISLGVKSGINIATTKDLIAFPKNRLGWFAGTSVRMSLNKKFFLQPELIYSSKGDKSDNQGSTSTLATRLNYINLPFLVGYHFDKKTSMVFGPETGYLVAARFIIGDNNLNVIKQHPPKFDIGVSIGFQYKVSKRFESEIRYNYGFKMLYSVDASGNRYSEVKGANRVFQIGIRYVINP